MLFTACCWYRDPHGLPWIEYLHTGAKKIWYGIPDEHNNNFKEALTKMLPQYCKNKTIWLPSDTAMVPPELLVSNGVSLCQTVQEPGQFIIVFPKAFTSSICTGYVVSESVYFAQPSWLETAEQVFKVCIRIRLYVCVCVLLVICDIYILIYAIYSRIYRTVVSPQFFHLKDYYLILLMIHDLI